VATILRFFGKQGYTSSQQWIPHIPTLQDSVFASQFPHPDAGLAATEVLVIIPLRPNHPPYPPFESFG
jgi:hypothetical protein